MLSGIVRLDKKHIDAKSESTPLEVVAIKSTAQNKSEILRVNGVTEASELVQLKAETDGLVKEIPAKQGQFLKKDDPILVLDHQNRMQNLKEAESELKRQKLAYESSKAIFQKQLGSEFSLADAEAKLRGAESKLKLTQDQYGKSIVQAPFDGFVDKINKKIGDFVSLNSNTELATFVNLNPILAVASIPEVNIANIDEMKKAKVTLRNNQVLDGDITFLSKVADNATKTYRIEVSLSNTDHKIFSGETIRMEIFLDEYKAHIIPKSAISLTIAGEVQVKIVDDSNKVVFKKINIIDENRDGFWVTGLPDVANIITLGHQYANEGEQVTVHVTKS